MANQHVIRGRPARKCRRWRLCVRVTLSVQVMDDPSTLTTLLVALSGVVAGSVLQALTGFLTDRRKQRADHDAWLRDKRLDAFDRVHEVFSRPVPGEADARAVLLDDLDAAITRLWVVAPTALYQPLADAVRDADRLFSAWPTTDEAIVQSRVEYKETAYRLQNAVRYAMRLHVDPSGLPEFNTKDVRIIQKMDDGYGRKR